MQPDTVCTFIVSLPESTERLRLTKQQLDKLDIKYRVWRAIKKENGAEGLIETLKYLFEHCLARNYERVVIFEDDIELTEDFNYYFNEGLKQLPDDFHLFYFGGNLLLEPTKYSYYLLKLTGAYATHAIMYSKEAMQMILNLLYENEDGLAYDQLLYKHIQPLGKCYITNKMVATQRTGVSNIFVYDPKTQVGIEKYYNIETNEINWGLMMQERFDMMTRNCKN